ncbi:MAG: CsgG/HfaB family protein [candidate division WOR-3 bacterium]
MKRLTLFMGALMTLGLVGCAAVAKYQADATLSPSFDLSRTYTLAVLRPEYSRASELMDALNREAMRAGFSVVERSKVETILDEQEFGYSGVVDPSTAARLGKLMGADAVLISQASDKFDAEYGSWETTVSGRIVSVETGEILYTCRARGGGMDKTYATEDAAGNFFKEIRKARGK